MAHSSGHITSPVSFTDVNATLGTSHTDLFTMCMDNNINMWSAYKPIYSSKIGLLTDADFSGQGHVVSGYKTGGGIKKVVKTGTTYKSDIGTDGDVSNAVWAYDKPVQDGICAARLADFNNYYHNAARIFRITNIFGNISYFFLPSSDAAAGLVVAFDMSFVSGHMTPAKLFGDCWSTFYPAVIISSGGDDKLNYVKSAPNPISAYTNSGCTIKVDTRIFMNKMKADWSAIHPGSAYARFPFRDGDKWTATLVLIDGYFDGGENDGSYKLGTGNNIVRLEYESPSGTTHVDRRTLPVKQSKFTNIEWMKMTVTITRQGIQSGNEVYTLSSISVKAKMLNTNTVSFVINASLSTPQGSVSVPGVSDPSDIQNYSQLTFSGQTGEITKSLVYSATTYYVPQSATVGNKLCNGSLTFHATEGDFTGTFSFDITSQSYQYEKEIQLL